MSRVSIVVAMGAKNRAIGKDGRLLWHISDDLKRFKELTLGHPVIMGRKTFESILSVLGKPLPERTNIVITRSSTLLGVHDPNVVIVHSLEEALDKARALDKAEIFIGGGTQIYEQALPHVDRLYLTLIEDDKEGDAHFPAYEHLFPRETFREERTTTDGIRYTWVNLER